MTFGQRQPRYREGDTVMILFENRQDACLDLLTYALGLYAIRLENLRVKPEWRTFWVVTDETEGPWIIGGEEYTMKEILSPHDVGIWPIKE